MEKVNKLFSIKTKLIVMLITISLIPVLVIGINSLITSRKVLSQKFETTSSQLTQEITRGINVYFTGMSNLIHILSNDINIKTADNETYFEFAKGLIANTKATDQSIINIYVGTEKGMFYVEPNVELPKDFNHKTRDWYIQAVENQNEIIITDPYIDIATGKIVISIVSAIKNNDTLVGVVGMDIDLATMSNALSDIKVGDSGYVYITDRNGILISHPDHSLIGTDTITNLSYWTKARDSQTGFYTYKYQGDDKYALMNTSELSEWKVIASINHSELKEYMNKISSTIIFISFLTIVSAIILALIFSWPISKNIKALLIAFNSLANGDLTTSVSIKSKDEFHLLSNNFNKMAKNISSLIRSVNNASTTVLDTSVSLANTVEETNASLGEVARAVEEVAKGAMEQAQNASEGAYNITELANRLNSINSSTENMDSLSKSTSEITLEGLNRVKELMVKSDNTMHSTTKVSDLVYATSESIKQIDAISNTIDMITSQTNLLSLNASIEASRAGESGKGFAVVANEIRKLADQSKASTEQIKVILEDITKKTNLSVEAMEVTNHNVKEQVNLVSQTQSSFNEIMNAVSNLSDMITDIKNNSNEIADQKNYIVSQIENISAISEESASATEEVTASTEQITSTMDEITNQAVDLHRLSVQLQNRINNFKF